MIRTLTSAVTVDSLRKEAKAWLKAIHAGDADALARLARAYPRAGHAPVLRDVQHAIALEFFAKGWQDLVDQIANLQSTDPRTHAHHSLMLAAGRGDAAGVAAILDARPDIIDLRGNLDGQTGRRTALHLAVAHESVVRLLLERGANPNIRDDGDYAYPLHFAAENQNLAVIRLLVEYGADPIGTGDLHELEVLGWATAWDYVTVKMDIVEYLLAHGARHNIFSAVAVGDVDAVRAIVGRSPADLVRPMDGTNHRRRPLHLAIVKGQPRVVRALLDLGAPLEVEDAAGLTPLDQAALLDEREMVGRLLERGASVRLPAAVALGRMDDAEALVRSDPSVLKPGGRWARLIVRAAERSTAEVIDLLVRFGASVDAFDDEQTAIDGATGYTPLHAAASKNNIATAAALLKHGASRSIRDNRYAGTPAGWARYFGNDAVAGLLLDGPIDIFEALDFDRLDRLADIVRRDPGALNRPFREYADPKPRSNQWWPRPETTPLEWARQKGKNEAVGILIALGAERR